MFFICLPPMALLEKELEVKPSSLPGTGQGLFTKTAIPKDSYIIEYKGRITTWAEAKDDWQNVYLYTVNAKHVIDARYQKKSLGRYVNDAAGLTRIKGITNNARFVNEGTRVFIVAAKNIKAGEEILVSYGKGYWDTVRANQKIDAQHT
jgi:SET domain-containing protein